MSYPGDDRFTVLNKERALFLKELAISPYCDILVLSQKLSIPEDRAWSYLKGFLAILAESSIDSDYLRVKNTINEGIEYEYNINENEIKRLVPLIEKYGDTDVVEKYKLCREQNKALEAQTVTHEEAAQGNADANRLNQSSNPTVNTGNEVPVYE
jgi:hypothetical protein